MTDKEQIGEVERLFDQALEDAQTNDQGWRQCLKALKKSETDLAAVRAELAAKDKALAILQRFVDWDDISDHEYNRKYPDHDNRDEIYYIRDLARAATR